MQFDKSFLKSKTLWVAIATIVAGFFPAVREVMKPENTEIILGSIGAIFGVLRLLTTKTLVVKEDKSKLS